MTMACRCVPDLLLARTHLGAYTRWLMPHGLGFARAPLSLVKALWIPENRRIAKQSGGKTPSFLNLKWAKMVSPHVVTGYRL